MFVIKYKTIFTLISAIVVLASIGAIVVFGLRPSIEFTGGTILEVSYPENAPSVEEVNEALSEEFAGSLAQPTDEGFIIRTRFLPDAERVALMETLSFGGTREVVEERVSSIGPTIGNELKTKAIYAIGVVAIATILFIAYVFRKVSKPVSSWMYGLVAITTLLHDIIIPAGFYALFGHLFGWEVDVLFIMALLAILGLSINDTIVIFDRIRENLLNNEESRKKEAFETTVGQSIQETYARSINTSLTTVLVLLAIFLFGSETTEHFAFALLVGMLVGTYSSVFLASPLLVMIERYQAKNAKPIDATPAKR